MNTCGLGPQAWRWMFIVMTVPAAAYSMLAYTVPESSRYLTAKRYIPENNQGITLLLGRRNPDLMISRIQDLLQTKNHGPSEIDVSCPACCTAAYGWASGCGSFNSSSTST